MKRWLMWSILSVATFLVGTIFVYAYLTLTSPKIFVEDPLDRPVTSTATTSSETGFVPLFRDLPNLENIDNTQLGTRLVDVLEYDENQGVFEYRKSEIVAKNGEQWLGLFNNNGVFGLRPIRIRVRLQHTPDDPDIEEFYAFDFKGNSVPVLLTRNAKSMKPGKIEAAFFKAYRPKLQEKPTGTKELKQEFSEEFTVSGKKSVLRVVKGLTLDGTKVNVLVIESENLQQIVTYNLYFNDSTALYDSIGELLFVGDLDGDQKLDLYISDFGFEKGGFGTQLFLSSEAAPGQQVGLAAAFETAGC